MSATTGCLKVHIGGLLRVDEVVFEDFADFASLVLDDLAWCYVTVAVDGLLNVVLVRLCPLVVSLHCSVDILQAHVQRLVAILGCYGSSGAQRVGLNYILGILKVLLQLGARLFYGSV